MKFAGFLLAIMVLFLSVQPVMASMQETEEASCAGGCCKQDQHEEETPSKDPCGSNCNPLLACSSYAGYFSINSYGNTVPFIKIKSPSASLTQDTYSSFSADFWQPPRFS